MGEPATPTDAVDTRPIAFAVARPCPGCARLTCRCPFIYQELRRITALLDAEVARG